MIPYYEIGADHDRVIESAFSALANDKYHGGKEIFF